MNYPEFIQLLSQFVSFKSISTDVAYKNDINKTADWLKNLFDTNGFTTELWTSEIANPVVFASYVKDTTLPTVLVYGHYDVQPAELNDGWTSEPFELRQTDQRLYARGVVDNKGQVLTHIYTVINLIKQNNLQYNVQFIIEGNEETSNEALAGLLKQNKQKITANYIMISDGEVASWKPCVEYSLRGGFNCKLTYTTAKTNVHSGIYGGAIPNAAVELCKFVNNLYLLDNSTTNSAKVNIDWFYDNVDPITAEQLDSNIKAVTDINEVLSNIGVKHLLAENSDMDLLTQTGLRPTIQVTGFKSGYVGEGFANIVPNSAEVRLNFRIVKSQNTAEIAEKFKEYVKQNTPGYVDYELKVGNTYDPIKIDISSSMVGHVKSLLAQSYNDEVIIKPVGGGIPVVSDFKEIFGIDTLLVSLGNEDCNMHGIDENFHVELLKKGLNFSELFFSTPFKG